MNNDIFPCLWFNKDGKHAADFYLETFGGKITVDTPMVINLDLFGQRFMLLNGGPAFEKNATISFMIPVSYTHLDVYKRQAKIATR